MRWGEKETCLFIKLYLKNDVLWNAENIDYKSKFKRTPAYTNIIEGFRAGTGIVLSVNDVKMKIRSLRSTYCQELAKIRNRSERGYHYEPTLKWFKQYHSRFNNLKKDVSDALEYEQEDELDLNMDDEKDDSKSDPFASQSQDADEDDYLVLLKSEPQEESSEDEPIPHKKKKRKMNSQISHIDTTERVNRISLEALRSLKEDEFDVYGKYIATQLRSMDLEKALRVQLQIQNLVSEARLSND